MRVNIIITINMVKILLISIIIVEKIRIELIDL